MRAIMLMFDSLNRHMLPPYGSREIDAPNFTRLAQHTTTFDRCYTGSMPCMPARRELHTGRYNFLHRSWGPLEPFDDSMPELLSNAGVHTHLASDHPHYWEDGGATYHTRYTTWEAFRGQEGDPWQSVVQPQPNSRRDRLKQQDLMNRREYPTAESHPQTLTVNAGVRFIDRNADADSWFVQIECFDPHEPFVSAPGYRERYPAAGNGTDWPDYGPARMNDTDIAGTRGDYAALVTMCDDSLGRVLDAMDRHDLWRDTMLIVNTDHGFLLGEHRSWGKSVQPWFEELSHLPLFIWDPRHPVTGSRRDALVQTIDIAPTLLAFFGLPAGDDMQGTDLGRVIAGGKGHDSALFGIHGGHVNVTDGQRVYMRAGDAGAPAPLEEYTLMPTHMRGRFDPEDLAQAQLVRGLSFTKGAPVLRIPDVRGYIDPSSLGTLLFDLSTDPGQEHPLTDDGLEMHMLALLREAMIDAQAPSSQYDRLGFPERGDLAHEHLNAARSADRARKSAPPSFDLTALPHGGAALKTSLRRLLGDPRSAALIRRRVPLLARDELVNMPAGATLAEVLTSIPVTDEAVATLSAELDALSIDAEG